MVQRHRVVDDDLRQLIGNHDSRKPAEDDFPLDGQADAPAFRTPAQRAQTVG